MNCKIVVFVVFSLAFVAEPVWSVCDTLKHIDKTLAIRIQYFGNRDQKPVSNDAAYKEDCGSYQESVKALDNYINNCLTDVSSKMGKIIMNSVREHFTKRCEDKQFGADFVEHNKCFENQTIFEEFHLCADRWYHQMQQLIPLNLDPVKAIQASCCVVHDFQRCVRDNNVNLCHDKNAKFWDTTIEDEVEDHKNEFCTSLKNSDQCAANFPQDLWAKISGPVVPMSPDQLRQKTGKLESMIFTVLDMAAGYSLKP